jgi:putative addiction module component (TIGR02574 family)
MSVMDIPNFEQLTNLERLELAEELVASIRSPESLPAPVAHRLELERRWAEYERNPAAALSQEQFWTKVWPEGFFDSIHITDPAFARPDQGHLPPVKPL